MAGTAAAVQAGLGTSAVTSAFTKGGAAGGAAMGTGIGLGLGRAVPIIAGGLAAIGVADFFGNAVDAASDLNESGNAVRVTFGDAADEIERLGSTAAARLGLTNTDFNAAAVRFSSFAEDLATDGRTVADVIDVITTRGADFASVYNIEVADALAIFQSGLSGEAEPLKRLGINLLDSEVAAYAYANGIAEVGKQLTQAQKIEARYGLLLQETAKVQGDFANTSDQLANKQRINAANLADALAKIGTALLPATTAFATFVGSDANVERLNRVVDLFIKAEPAVSGIADGFLAIADIKLSELDTILKFLEAVEDGNLSLQESIDILSSAPDYLVTLGLGLAGFYNGIANTVIDGTNTVRQGFADIINFAATVLGIGTKIKFAPIPHLSTVTGFSTAGAARGSGAAKKFPGQADGGKTLGAGWSWVGERGPELLHMPVGATVVPLDSGGPLGGDVRPYLVRLIEAVEANRVMVADGQVLAATASNGNAQLTALGAA